jgi:hypothetical protein
MSAKTFDESKALLCYALLELRFFVCSLGVRRQRCRRRFA